MCLCVCVCVCVCACEREREREREKGSYTPLPLALQTSCIFIRCCDSICVGVGSGVGVGVCRTMLVAVLVRFLHLLLCGHRTLQLGMWCMLDVFCHWHSAISDMDSNNDNSVFISTALFHIRHAELR